ncbi:hypothetical protein LSAT2_031007 [Lamellibrachia satsuma]|nr:hypothetical protein LSAT2_031007 [Lamellibrachia satsuma]
MFHPLLSSSSLSPSVIFPSVLSPSALSPYLLSTSFQAESCNVFYMLKKKVLSIDSCVTVTCESNNRLLLLFLWAIIRRHLDLAKLFWAEIKEERIAAALLAKILLKAMNAKTIHPAETAELSVLMAYFDDLAVGVLKKCYDKDTDKARLLLIRKLSNFGGKTTLELAVEARSKLFVEHAACQTLLDSIWRGKMALDTCRIKGTHDDGGNTSQPSGDYAEGTFCQKLCAFYGAPIGVFSTTSVSIRCFL